MTKKALQAYFQTQLLNWASTIQRDLPWKGNKNAYYIWLSEIILQQTKVQQGKPYYEKFIAKYPDIEALALAPEDDILKLWQGLGYYARARNMQQAAQSILRDHQGQFPKTYEDILALKGVGEYTAAAIASFAFDLAYAVVDGNVYRVLSRFFGIDIAINTSKGRQLFQQLANVLLDTHKPAVYNQAIMDFGAIHCKPKKPLCTSCLMRKHCYAFQNKKVSFLPVKKKAAKKRDRFFYYLVSKYKDKIQLRKRQEKDIWKGLFDFPILEMDQFYTKKELVELPELQKIIKDQKTDIQIITNPYKQILSHQRIIATFIEMEKREDFFLEKEDLFIVERKKLRNFAFPKIVQNYLDDKSSSLFLVLQKRL